MKLIAGLGNPSKEYAATRHNMGFDAVTAISDTYGIKWVPQNAGNNGKRAL